MNDNCDACFECGNALTSAVHKEVCFGIPMDPGTTVAEAQDASFSVVRHTGSLATIDMFQLERREDRGYGWVPEHIKFIPRY
jgi:hypothetical protein